MIVFGGEESGNFFTNELWALDLGDAPAWHLLTSGTSTIPSARAGASLVIDADADRLVLFGGALYAYSAPLDDTWTYGLTNPDGWIEVQTDSKPSARTNHGAVFDPAGHQMVIIGGDDTSFDYPGDVWALHLSPPSWQQIHTATTSALRRDPAFVILDAARGRALFGGGQRDFGEVVYADVWSVDLHDSTLVSKVAAQGRYGAFVSAVHDAISDRLIVRAQQDTVVSSLPDLTDWDSISHGPPRFALLDTYVNGLPALVEDRDQERLLAVDLFSGTPNIVMTQASLQDWSTAWAPVQFTGDAPLGGFGASVTADPVRGRLIMIGGLDHPVGSTSISTLRLADMSWTEVIVDGPSPLPRTGHGAVLDAKRDRLLIFSGNGSPNDLWALALADPPRWTQIATVGEAPSRREGAVMAIDVKRDRLLITGGYRYVVGTNELSAIWMLPLVGAPTWSRLTSTAAPDFYSINGGFYDCTNDALVLLAPSTITENPMTQRSGNPNVACYDNAEMWALFFGTSTWRRVVPERGAPWMPMANSEVVVTSQSVLLFALDQSPVPWGIDPATMSCP
jgi:hypothetical protein